MATPYAPRPAVKQPSRPASGGNLWTVLLSVLALIAVLGIGAVFVVFPVILKARCVDAAKARGITLSIDHVAIGLGEVRLIKLDFTLDGVPQLKAHADDAQVPLSGLTPAGASLNGLAVALDGPAEEVQQALDAWRTAQAHHVTATEAADQHVSFLHAHLTWTRAFGQTATLESQDATGDADAGAGSLRMTAEQVTVAAGRAKLGPWRVSLERGSQGTRTNVELDPVVPGGPGAVYTRSPEGAVSVKMNLPRSPLSRLGVPPKAAGLGSDPEVEGQVSFEEALSKQSTMSVNLTLTRAVFSGMPIDAQLRFDAAGDVAKGLDVKRGTLRAGPISAGVSGTVKLFDDGVRLSLAWASKPVPCEELGKELANQALGQLANQIGSLVAGATQLGNAVGLHVTGSALASGLITLDSRDVGATSFTMTANETCGLALF